jgi:hypothetical protein
MKSPAIQMLTVLSLVAGAARVASAAEPSSPWSLSISGGDSVDERGSLRTRETTGLAGLSALDPTLSGTSGTLRLDTLKYEDLFRRRFDTGLELDYSFNDNLQSYGRFGYASLGGRTTTIGELESGTSPAALRAHFADADNMTYELGSRYFWTTGADWRPFAGLALGATHLDSMRATLTSTDLSLPLNDLRFSRAGTVFSQSLTTGVDYTPNEVFGLRFSIDADHFGRPAASEDPRLSALGAGGDDAHGLWSFPVAIAANYRF